VSTAGKAVTGSASLDFVYRAPTSRGGAAPAADELANVVTRLQNETLRDLDEAARSRMGAELGRALGPGGSYATLSTAERLSLSAETRGGARDLRLGRIAMALSMANPQDIGLMDLSDEFEAAGQERSDTREPSEVVSIYIDTLVDARIGAVKAAGSHLCRDSVSDLSGGAEAAAELWRGLAVFGDLLRGHEPELRRAWLNETWSRFERGDLTLTLDGRAIEPSAVTRPV
jgi:hypothetical protein